MQAVGVLGYVTLTVRSETSRGAEDSISRAASEAITCPGFPQQRDLWEAVLTSYTYATDSLRH